MLKKLGILVLVCLLAVAAYPQTYRLTVVIKNVKVLKGHMQVSLYNDSGKFPKDGQEYKTQSVPVTSRPVKAVFFVPPGQYAIATFHDQNDNGHCDMRMGFPPEPFGFSNNVHPRIKAPSFRRCKFFVRGDTIVQINLIDHAH